MMYVQCLLLHIYLPEGGKSSPHILHVSVISVITRLESIAVWYSAYIVVVWRLEANEKYLESCGI